MVRFEPTCVTKCNHGTTKAGLCLQTKGKWVPGLACTYNYKFSKDKKNFTFLMFNIKHI